VSKSYAIEQWEEKEKAAGSEVREYAYKERRTKNGYGKHDTRKSRD
jgi:hypothetical protein